MKTLLILTLLISTNLYAKRKVSNTYYYYCTVERSGDIGDSFKDEYVFLLRQKQEDTSIKKSKRWAETEISLSKDYQMQITILENFKGKEKKITGKLDPEGLSYSSPVVLDKEFKFTIDEKEVRYNLHCE
jgi:hypothetical protein